MFPGLHLRQARERLGLTYRAVEQASYALATNHGRREFITRISRLADIENGGVIPCLHKLYTLCSVYHLDLMEVCSWYDVPLADLFHDQSNAAAPNTHPASPPRAMRPPVHFDPGFDPQRTAFLSSMVEDWLQFEAVMLEPQGHSRYRYGYIGLEDHWMEPILRPGTLVLLDPSRQQVHNSGWRNEFEWPIYFVDARDHYRCSWCLRERNLLILQPHPLSSRPPEALPYPDQAEVVGQVVGWATRLAAS